MAGKLATDLRAADRIVISLAAADGNPAGKRQAFAGTFNSAGEPVDAKGEKVYGVPALDLGGIATQDKGGAPEFPMAEFNRLITENGNKPSAATATLLADYNAKVAAWEGENGGTGAGVADRIRQVVLKYVEAHFDVRLTAQTGEYLNLDPAKVICRPSYREGDRPVTFTVAMTPVWGN